jgi:16S rRNA (cytidine1402-2'-O)-methyltransferase
MHSHDHDHDHAPEAVSVPGEGMLYVVGTPIGNLEDISFRAVAVLTSVDLILCEDTRMTARLLERYGIVAPTLSYHAHSSKLKEGKIVELLRSGKRLALVSDAGTPGISDPGAMLVAKIRTEAPEIRVVAVPGPSAFVSALSISGVPTHEFTFLGFLPHKKGRETLFKEIAAAERTMVFYESPHRIEKTLASLALHAPGKKVTIARELTKVFEQVVSGSAEELARYFKEHQDKVRGEFVVMVS